MLNVRVVMGLEYKVRMNVLTVKVNSLLSGPLLWMLKFHQV